MTVATSRTRRIDDAGEKIGGARKDFRVRQLNLDDLEQMTEAEAIEKVTKDNVWPKPDFGALIEAGMPVRVAAYVKVIRDNMAQKPTYLRGVDPAEVRKGFIRMTGIVRDLLLACTSVEDVANVYEKAKKAIGEDAAARAAFRSITKATSSFSPLIIQPSYSQKVNRLLNEGFPETPAWRRGIQITPGDGGRFVLFRNKKFVDSFPDVEAALAWAKKDYEQRQEKNDKPKTPPIPSRPHIDRLVRDGLPDVRNGRDISPEDFIETFGFRAVEFGLWLPDDERQRTLNVAYEALHDLAYVLNWGPKALSLGNRLAIAFGSRGKGRASAHYESDRAVINMTRLKGGGTLAHEWAHAFDHWAGEVNYEGNSKSVRSGTGWRHLLYGNEHRKMLSNLEHHQAEQWVSMVESLFYTRREKEEAEADYLKRLGRAITNRRTVTERVERARELPPDKQDRRFLEEARKWLDDNQKLINSLSAQIEEVNAADPAGDFGTRMSDYATEARKLCGPSGEYWIRPNEMFARAFESWVFDKLNEMGCRSDYLVSGCEESRFASGYKGNPYPVGRERKVINERIASVVSAMQPTVELSFESTKTLVP